MAGHFRRLGCSLSIAFGKKKPSPSASNCIPFVTSCRKICPPRLKTVAKQGYECVEFFSPYFEWTTDYAKKIRSPA